MWQKSLKLEKGSFSSTCLCATFTCADPQKCKKTVKSPEEKNLTDFSIFAFYTVHSSLMKLTRGDITSSLLKKQRKPQKNKYSFVLLERNKRKINYTCKKMDCNTCKKHCLYFIESYLLSAACNLYILKVCFDFYLSYHCQSYCHPF